MPIAPANAEPVNVARSEDVTHDDAEVCVGEEQVFATVLSLVVSLVGLISYQRLAVREYPRIDKPVVSVATTYRGASAEVVETPVARRSSRTRCRASKASRS